MRNGGRAVFTDDPSPDFSSVGLDWGRRVASRALAETRRPPRTQAVAEQIQIREGE
jgi:hypothetical protein